jgi:hypothetical protein
VWKPQFREHPDVDHRRLVGGARDQLSEGEIGAPGTLSPM